MRNGRSFRPVLAAAYIVGYFHTTASTPGATAMRREFPVTAMRREFPVTAMRREFPVTAMRREFR